MKFIKKGLLLVILLVIDNAYGKICISTDGYDQTNTCSYTEVCCGARNLDCCNNHDNRQLKDVIMVMSFFLAFIVLLVFVCFLISCCCCWFLNRRSGDSAGVVYRQAAVIDGNTPNRIVCVPQPNQSQVTAPYGMSSSVYQETTQMLSSDNDSYIPMNDQLKLVKSEA